MSAAERFNDALHMAGTFFLSLVACVVLTLWHWAMCFLEDEEGEQ